MFLLRQKKGQRAMKQILFLILFLAAVRQDIKSRSLDGRFLMAGIGIGVIFCFLREREWISIFCAAAVGLVFLAAGRLTSGEIGEGDGWFFIITGLFLEPWENIMLAVSGLFLCFLFCLVLFAASFHNRKSVGKMRLPFLPFLIPGGLWIIFH